MKILHDRNRLIFHFFIISCLFKIVLSDILKSFYSYKKNDIIPVSVGNMNSEETQIPFDYYYLNICPPEKNEILSDNLGEILTGDILQKSKYQIKVGMNEYCKTLCNMQINTSDVQSFNWIIGRNYTSSWFVDRLPAGLKNLVDQDSGEADVHYLGGIPIGYKKSNSTYSFEYHFYNHFTFTLQIHMEADDTYTIVGFNIMPFSINQNNSTGPKCSANDAIENFNKEKQQITEGNALITYDVIFEISKIPFSSRWDHYLHLNNDNIHWYSLINSSLIIIIFSLIILHIFCRALKKDIDIYNTRVTGEDFINELGWRQVCHDAFRRPNYPMLLSSMIGTGMQLFIMITYTLIFAMIGFYTPEKRGSLLTIMIFLFVFLGVIAGYYSERFYKMFGGKAWLKNSLLTAFLYPSILFTIFMILNLLFWIEGSSASVIFINLFRLNSPIFLSCLSFGFAVQRL